jgi:hypothetical protein
MLMLITAARQMWRLFHDFAAGEELYQSSNQISFCDLMDKLLKLNYSTPETPAMLSISRLNSLVSRVNAEAGALMFAYGIESGNLGARRSHM